MAFRLGLCRAGCSRVSASLWRAGLGYRPVRGLRGRSRLASGSPLAGGSAPTSPWATVFARRRPAHPIVDRHRHLPPWVAVPRPLTACGPPWPPLPRNNGGACHDPRDGWGGRTPARQHVPTPPPKSDVRMAPGARAWWPKSDNALLRCIAASVGNRRGARVLRRLRPPTPAAVGTRRPPVGGYRAPNRPLVAMQRNKPLSDLGGGPGSRGHADRCRWVGTACGIWAEARPSISHPPRPPTLPLPIHRCGIMAGRHPPRAPGVPPRPPSRASHGIRHRRHRHPGRNQKSCAIIGPPVAPTHNPDYHRLSITPA